MVRKRLEGTEMSRGKERELTQTGKAIMAIMEKREMGTIALADALGGKPVSTISDRIRQTNISVDKLNEIVRVLGYKIMLVPAGTKGDGFYDIGGDDK